MEMSLWLQLPEQRGLGSAKPASLDRIAPPRDHCVLMWEEGIMWVAGAMPRGGGVGAGTWARILPVCTQQSQSRTFYCCSGLLLANLI